MDALPLIVFDVNETLLDLTTMEPTFERIFRDKGAMRFWSCRWTVSSESSVRYARADIGTVPVDDAEQVRLALHEPDRKPVHRKNIQ